MAEVKPNDFNKIKGYLTPLVDAKGMSFEQLARAAQLSKASIYHYLNDTRRPSEESMRRICDVLDRPHDEGLATFTAKKVGRTKGNY